MSSALRPLINWTYGSVLLPLLERRSYWGVASLERQYAAHEQRTLAENRERQWREMQTMLRHAYETTPFYRRRFDEAGIPPQSIQSPDDLQRLPQLTRDDLRHHVNEMLSARFRPDQLTKAATGGTTDTPVTLYRSAASLPYKNAVQARFNAWAGFRPGDKVFYLWGAQSDYAPNPSWRWRFYDQTLMRRFWAPTSVFNEKVYAEYREILGRMRPRVMYAYPVPLAMFSEYLLAKGGDYHRPEVVISTAELMTDEQRRTIEAAMGSPVFEQYGARDFGMVAGECSAHRGMHWNPHAVFIEQLPLAGMESEGLHEMIVTDLLNFGMPLIRYRVNDCCLPGAQECSCGIGYPKIERVMGRTSDNFYLADGTAVSGVIARRLGNYCPGVSKLQLIQEAYDRFTIRYIAGPGFTPGDVERMREKLLEAFGRTARLDFERVETIERERSGKTRLCISRVTPPRPTPTSAARR